MRRSGGVRTTAAVLAGGMVAAALAVAALTGSPASAAQGLPSTPLTHAATRPAAARPAPVVKAQAVTPGFDPQTIAALARHNGTSVAQAQAVVVRQVRLNNALARLESIGVTYDGSFFTDDGRLVVQTPSGSAGSAAATAARRAGLTVRSVRNGEARLNAITAELNAVPGARTGIVSYGPDVVRDRVVVETTGTNPAPGFLAAARRYGAAVTVTPNAAPHVLHATVRPGDHLRVDSTGGFCSAGVPAHTKSGYHAMLWAGHCVEYTTSVVYNGYGTPIGLKGPTGVKDYDGKPDRDLGIIWLTKGNGLSTAMETFGTGYFNPRLKGPWKPPVGSFLCKGGTVTGVTCGRITAYEKTINYYDAQRRLIATLTHEGQSSVCSLEGDSGAPMEASSYAVGLVSGGVKGAVSCRRNSGPSDPGETDFQPVSDALAYYQLIWN